MPGASLDFEEWRISGDVFIENHVVLHAAH